MQNNWLINELKNWTPFSVMAVIMVLACMVILVLFPIYHLDIPNFVYVILSIIGGGTGSVQMLSHGVTIANGVAKSTAAETVKSVSQNLTVTNKEP